MSDECTKTIDEITLLVSTCSNFCRHLGYQYKQ